MSLDSVRYSHSNGIYILMFLIFSCASPLDKKFSEETSEGDIKEIRSKLDSADLMLLAGSIIRLKLSGEDMEQMTYNEILNKGRDWKKELEIQQAEQKAMAEKARLEEEERTTMLTESVMVSCFHKSYAKIDYQDYITFKFAISNKTDKSIRAVKGVLVFTNLFGDEIKSISFVYDQTILPNSDATWNAQTDYNQFIDSDVALKNKDLEDLIVVWKPEKIIFDDGTSLE